MRWWLFCLVPLMLLSARAGVAGAQQRIDVQTIVEAADTNNDGYIDRVEYLRRMSEAFFFVDVNKDGFLTNKEIQQTVSGSDPQQVQAADANQDGKLSMYEFHKAVDQGFNKADTNEDGLLSREEVKRRWGSPTG